MRWAVKSAVAAACWVLAPACAEPAPAAAQFGAETATAVDAGGGAEDSATGPAEVADTAAAPETSADTAPTPDLAPAPDVPAAPDAKPDVAKPKPTYTAAKAHCGDLPPAGANLAAAPKKYSGGTCPKLVADGVTENEIVSSGAKRQFLLQAPADLKPGEKVPVLFAWHWLKGSAKGFVDKGEFAKAVPEQRFIAIAPESKNDINIQIPMIKNPVSFPWPILSLTDSKRFEEEYAFFDDMLACVSEQFGVDKECVSVTGVSAGALFGAQLVSARSEYVSSYLSLSGGVQSPDPFVNTFLPKWKQPAHKLPMLVLWGGPNDSCALLNFQSASQALETQLDDAQAFVVECIHNCGHGVPPVDAQDGKSQFASLWDFAFSHPYWLPLSQSPWAKELPKNAPPWCAIGSGNAKIRTGACGDPACPI